VTAVESSVGVGVGNISHSLNFIRSKLQLLSENRTRKSAENNQQQETSHFHFLNDASISSTRSREIAVSLLFRHRAGGFEEYKDRSLLIAE
jgi:predicted mannosyl-3-phosphoglycerate phosphatase (HAD superfamily)